jgi:hypothetical protein
MIPEKLSADYADYEDLTGTTKKTIHEITRNNTKRR